MTLETTRNAISLPGSASGHTPCAERDGRMINLSGRDRALANLSARQARKAGLLMSGTYGPLSITSLTSVGLQLSLENRLQAATLMHGSTLYNLTWKQWVTPMGLSRFRLRASVRRTSESAPIGWPTPTTSNDRYPCPQEAMRNYRENGTKIQKRLQDVAALTRWPTPTATDYKGGLSGGTDAQREVEHGSSGCCSTVSQPLQVNGFWRDADWLSCRDGKWRPVEPGTFPLAYGITNRMGRLRAYGNAINAEAAKAFIAAFLDVRRGN